MPYQDLRDFLSRLEQEHVLCKVKAEVDWNEEIGAISQEAAERGNPALLFENIKDHQQTQGRRLAANIPGNFHRLNLALGLPADAPPLQIIELVKERAKGRIKPTLVSNGPCKEIIEREDEVNLLQFPVPKIHPKDGGRYIMTSCMVISKDPETEWTNVGTYRGMVHDKRSIGALYHPSQHQGVHGRKYQALGKPMPLAVAIGVEPAMMFASASPVPVGVDEYDVMGAFRGEPIEVVRCETLDLLVPAQAEVILEGEMDLNPATYRPEGPFGEYPGHYSTLWSEPAPVFTVKCITHRKDPILECASHHRKAGSYNFMGAVGHAALVWSGLESHGVQGVKGVYIDPEMPMTNLFIAIEKLYYGHAKQAAAAVWGMPISFEIGKFIVVVDYDVDISNLKEVNRAMGNRVQGMRDVVIYPWTFGGPLDPAVPPETKRRTGGIGSWDRVLIDATWPFEWEAREEWGGLRHPPACVADEDMLARVRNRWKEYGLDQF